MQGNKQHQVAYHVVDERVMSRIEHDISISGEDRTTARDEPPARFRAPKPGFVKAWLADNKEKINAVWPLRDSSSSSDAQSHGYAQQFILIYYLQGLNARLTNIATFLLLFVSFLFVYFLAGWLGREPFLMSETQTNLLYFVPLVGIGISLATIISLVIAYMPELPLPKDLADLPKLSDQLVSRTNTLTGLLWMAAVAVVILMILAGTDYFFYTTVCKTEAC